MIESLTTVSAACSHPNPLQQQVHLAAETEVEGCIEERRRQRESRRDVEQDVETKDQSGPAASPKTSPTDCANRGVPGPQVPLADPTEGARTCGRSTRRAARRPRIDPAVNATPGSRATRQRSAMQDPRSDRRKHDSCDDSPKSGATRIDLLRRRASCGPMGTGEAWVVASSFR